MEWLHYIIFGLMVFAFYLFADLITPGKKMHNQLCQKIKQSEEWKAAVDSLKTKEALLLTWCMIYSRINTKEFIRFVRSRLERKGLRVTMIKKRLRVI